MDIVIEKATYEHIPAIHHITMEAFQSYALDLGIPSQVKALNDTYESISEDIDKKIVLVALWDSEVVGSIRCEILSPGDVGYISRFGVSPHAHNMGIGKALIMAVEEEAVSKGVTLLTLHTASKMSSLVRFYYGMGYYIHSTSTDRGYIRAYFCKDIGDKYGVLSSSQHQMSSSRWK